MALRRASVTSRDAYVCSSGDGSGKRTSQLDDNVCVMVDIADSAHIARAANKQRSKIQMHGSKISQHTVLYIDVEKKI